MVNWHPWGTIWHSLESSGAKQTPFFRWTFRQAMQSIFWVLVFLVAMAQFNSVFGFVWVVKSLAREKNVVCWNLIWLQRLFGLLQGKNNNLLDGQSLLVLSELSSSVYFKSHSSEESTSDRFTQHEPLDSPEVWKIVQFRPPPQKKKKKKQQLDAGSNESVATKRSIFGKTSSTKRDTYFIISVSHSC